jgi:hypothetical protein
MKQKLTEEYVGRHLASTSSDADIREMLGLVASEKAKVGTLLNAGVDDYLGLVAGITGATYPCKNGGGELVKCYNRKDIVHSWSHNGDKLNAMRMAFIWYYAVQEIFQMASLGSHGHWLEKQVMETLNVEYYPPVAKGGGVGCIRALYSYKFNNHRFNCFRYLGGSHDNQIQITHPPNVNLGLPRVYKRPKAVFFVRQLGKWEVVSISWRHWRGPTQCLSIRRANQRDCSICVCTVCVCTIGGLQG